MMSDEWRADLRLMFEDLVDKFVTKGVEHEDILKAIGEEIENRRKAKERDPDPAEDDSVIEEPANDWPAAT
ncbi:hypothetical protein DEM27_20135 [Metarhizobium album]|uniref:Uncharacterized protein n=1 Tax=Metarhizobium album TaxID=2182425 RepID=A0A2U2DMB1_9HYPH|nr:hypothetical protein [Rhizobium album]PWE54421.1 hypothetical protein DEM27_20135 [Rhizobium album]